MAPRRFATETKLALWHLHRTAATYGQRPSTLIRVDPDRPLAYILDREAAAFGTHIENKLQERTDKGAPKHSLYKLLGLDFEAPGHFASIKGLKKRGR